MTPDDGNTSCTDFKLFGVQIVVSGDDVGDGGDGGAAAIRRTKSMGNIDDIIPEKASTAAAADESGYITDGNLDSKSRERKRGNPWTEDEHRSFLEGLHKLGKGDWKGISSKFVPSRKSSQVASHAQKYFNRVNTTSQVIKKRRRASVFDIASNHDTASSSSVAANVNATEPSIPAHVPNSERPPLAPIKQSIQDIRGVIYQPRVSTSIPKAYQTQTVIPTISWVPVVNFQNQNGVLVPSIHGGFVPQQQWRQTWIQTPRKTTTNNDELNRNIRNLTL